MLLQRANKRIATSYQVGDLLLLRPVVASVKLANANVDERGSGRDKQTQIIQRILDRFLVVCHCKVLSLQHVAEGPEKHN